MNIKDTEMNEQELREKIKDLEHKPPRKGDCLNRPYEKDGLHYDPFVANPICSDCFADQILALVKEAGWVKPTPYQSRILEFCRKVELEVK